MRSATPTGCSCARVNSSVASRAAFSIHTHSYQPLAQLDVNVGSPSPSFALAPRDELVPPSLACVLPAIEHPTMK